MCFVCNTMDSIVLFVDKKTKYPKDYKERLEEGRLVGSKILK